MTLQKLQKFLFYLLLFCLPFNLGKHFILPSSYVSGILVDYLIPTIYLTDIITLVLLFLWLWPLINSKFKRQNLKLKNKIKNFGKLWPILALVYLLINTILAPNQIAAFYKFFKLLEFSLLAIYIKNNINVKKDILVITKVLALSVIFQTILSLGQWTNQGSLFNNYLFFGEQPYTLSTPGIKKIAFLGEIKAPAMGTFTHPNVLAGFLVLTLPFIFSLRKTNKWLFFFCFSLLAYCLFLTFSYPCWLAFILMLVFITLKPVQGDRFKPTQADSSVVRHAELACPERSRRVSASILFLFLSLFLLFSSSFNLDPESFSRRNQLNQIAIKMFLKNPLTGVGLNNFTVVMEKYGEVVGFTRFLQPVHHGYLLILSETGLIGFVIFLVVYLKILRKVLKKKNFLSCFTFFAFSFTLLFDHYLFTTQQGLLLTFLLLSLC